MKIGKKVSSQLFINFANTKNFITRLIICNLVITIVAQTIKFFHKGDKANTLLKLILQSSHSTNNENIYSVQCTYGDKEKCKSCILLVNNCTYNVQIS